MRPDRLLSRFSLGWQLAAALLLGLTVGMAAGPRSAILRPLADLQLALLKGLAVPAVVAFALAGVSGVSPRRMGALGLRLVAAFALLSLAATALGAACAILLVEPAKAVSALRQTPQAPLALPDPPPASAALALDHAIPMALLAALLAGFTVAAWRERDPCGPAAALHGAFRQFAGLVTRAIGLVLVYLPVGVFALVAVAVGGATEGKARGLAGALAGVYAAQGLVSLALVGLAAAGGESPRRFLAAIRDALVAALATGSSAASLPVEMRSAVVGLRRNPASTAFALSLGAALSKTGTAAFLGALGAAALRLAGLPADATHLGPVVLAATAAALVTPPVAGGGFVMLGFAVQHAGLPLDLVPILVALPFVGKANTPVNALGRLACVAALIPREDVGQPGTVSEPVG